MRFFTALLLFLGLAGSAWAESGGIHWYATWESGLREAQRTQKPILLIAAAPHCHNVSGIW